MLALDKYREKLNEGSCQCELCKFLTSTETNAINLRIWASQFNPTFEVHGRHEDAEEFLRVLIEKCGNLSNLVHFDTKEKHTCATCGEESPHVGVELNRDIKTCPIDIACQNENTADMIKRTFPKHKPCVSCHTMNTKDGATHSVTERYTRLPQVHVVSANRYDENHVKITKRVYPSPIIEIDEVTYYLKAVVRHSGGLERGHCITALLWNPCGSFVMFLMILKSLMKYPLMDLFFSMRLLH